MAEAAIGRLLTAETTFDPGPVLVIFVLYKVALVQFSLPEHRFFSCQYNSTDDPFWSPSMCCSYQKDKRVKPGNLPKS